MIGVICLEHVGSARRWSLEDQGFAASLADLLALGMEIAERHRAQRLLEEYSRTLEQKVEERTREVREKQAQLVQSEKMAALGNLVAGIVHEINNPLAALSCSNATANRLVSRMKDNLADREKSPDTFEPARLHELLEQVEAVGETTQAAAHRIMGIISSLRSFAGLDRAAQDRVDIHEGLESGVTLLQHLLVGRITLHKDYGAIPPMTCRPSQLNQVFMNLLVNAIEAIQPLWRYRHQNPHTGPICRCRDIRYWNRDRARESLSDLRSRIYNQGSEGRNWIGACDRPQDRRGASRKD